MILIFEGADLVGKTTLLSRFAAKYHWPVVKIRWALTGDTEIEMRTMANVTIEILRSTQPDVIFDRSYFSWWAYGPVLGHDVSFMPDLIARFAQVNDARLVLLTVTPEELQRRFEREPEHRFPLKLIQAANARFPSLLALVPPTLPYLHIDTTSTSPDEAFAQVDAFIHTT